MQGSSKNPDALVANIAPIAPLEVAKERRDLSKLPVSITLTNSVAERVRVSASQFSLLQ